MHMWFPHLLLLLLLPQLVIWHGIVSPDMSVKRNQVMRLPQGAR